MFALGFPQMSIYTSIVRLHLSVDHILFGQCNFSFQDFTEIYQINIAAQGNDITFLIVFIIFDDKQ
jgi:hypothetical protein